ncbi:MAG: RcnB family protein [Sphingomicrobium sp.]
MRKIILGMLLASVAATPALAAPGDWQARSQARAERQQSDDNDNGRNARRPQVSRPEQPQQVERVERPERPEPRTRMAEAPVPMQAQGRPDLQAMRNARQDARQQAPDARNWRQRDRARANLPNGAPPRVEIIRDRIEQRRQDARDRFAHTPGSRPPVISPTPQPGTQPPPPPTQRPTSSQSNWNHGWRHDRRYDWNDYRRRHRSLFNLGFYFDPFGWGYQRYNIGWRMWPSYFGSQYWLNDPWQYRLPYAPAGYRWVRYWDDAVLVDTWSGEVVDVIYSFFW